MIKGILINTETNTTRETIGSFGIVATIDKLGQAKDRATVDIHIEYDEDSGDAEYSVIIKEILKFTIEGNRTVFANAVYQACRDTGLLSEIGGMKCLLFGKK